MTPAIQLEGVTAGYADVVVEGVDLSVEPLEYLGLVGPNGGGKTTLLRVILGLLTPWAGSVRVLGEPPARVRPRIGYVPQYASFSRDFPVCVREVVLTGRLGRTRSVFGFDAGDKRIAAQSLDEVELGELAGRPIATLSGGQLQRVLIARALASRPELLILDEPTASIDPAVERSLFDLLSDLNHHMTIVVSTHDVAFVTEYARRVACLNRTLVCHETRALDGAALESLYGHGVRAVDHSHEARSA